MRFFSLLLLTLIIAGLLPGEMAAGASDVAGVSGAKSTSAHPRFSMAMDHMEPLGAADCPWDFVRANLGVFQFEINDVAYLASAESIKRLAPLLKGGKMEVAIEGGHFDWVCSNTQLALPNPKGIADHIRPSLEGQIGRMTADMEMRKIDLLTSAGVAPAIVVMDGPIRRLLFPGEDVGKPEPAKGIGLDRAVGEILEYMKAWRVRFPRVRFVALTNFPNWAWKSWPAYRPDRVGWGDYAPKLHALAQAAREAGLPLAGVRVDCPIEYLKGTIPVPAGTWDPQMVDWVARLRDLESTVRGEGLQFELILNSQFAGQASARAFYLHTLEHLALCRKIGLTPDLYMVQSWYPFPKQAGPEGTPYTLAYLTAAVILDFQGEPGAALARELAAPRPRTANPHIDLAAPTTPQGNAFPDGLGAGDWSCWLATGAPSPIGLTSGTTQLKPMAWNGQPKVDKPGAYKNTIERGYTAAPGQDYPSILLDRIDRTQFVPHVGADPVLRWTARKAGRIRLAGDWYLPPPGNVNLGIFVDGRPVFRRDGYTDTSDPGLLFQLELNVKPGTSVEWWVDANGDPSYDNIDLALDISLLP